MVKNALHKTIENADMRISYREGVIPAEEIFENHCHTRYELIAVLDGRVNIVVGTRKYTLHRAETVIIPPLTYHSVYSDGEIMYKRATVLFDEGFVPKEILGDFKEKTERRPVSIHASQRAPLEALEELFSADGNADTSITRFTPLVASLLTEIIYIHTYKEADAKREKSNPTVNAVTEYIDTHVTEKITLGDISSHTFLSKSTISHLFSDEMKISVKQYVLQKKLAYAAKLISEGASAAVAAETIGYDNYANFYKMYKKIMGSSPKEKKRVK